jgi:hypothetical protein
VIRPPLGGRTAIAGRGLSVSGGQAPTLKSGTGVVLSRAPVFEEMLKIDIRIVFLTGLYPGPSPEGEGCGMRQRSMKP